MIITKSHAEEATARPWRVDHNARVEIKQDTDEWSSMIATVYKSGRCNGNNYRMPALANAQLIVTAVNSYDALQAANKELWEACEAAFPLLLSYEDVMVNDIVDDGELVATRLALHQLQALRGEKQG